VKVLSKISSSRYFRIGVGIIFSGLTLYLAFKNVSFREVGETFTKANLFFVGLALFTVVANTLAKVLRWRVLLGPVGRKVGFSPIANSFLAGQMLNAVVPARIGELSRIYVVGGRGPGRTFVLGTIVLEKILDMVCYALLFILLLVLIPLPKWISNSGIPFIAATILVAIFVFSIAYQRDRVIRLIDRESGRIPEAARGFLAGHIRLGINSLEVFQRLPELVKLAAWSAFIWGTAVLTNQLVSLSFGVHLPWVASILLLVTLQAGISIPSLPGKIGVFEYICVLTLGLFGIDQSAALSYGILLHAVVYLPMILAGVLSFWLLGLGRWRTSLDESPAETPDDRIG